MHGRDYAAKLLLGCISAPEALKALTNYEDDQQRIKENFIFLFYIIALRKAGVETNSAKTFNLNDSHTFHHHAPFLSL